jgi:hypothetical protein
MWNLLPITQQDNNENANMTYDEDESLSNKIHCHELNYRSDWQDAQGKESIPVMNDLIQLPLACISNVSPKKILGQF